MDYLFGGTPAFLQRVAANTKAAEASKAVYDAGALAAAAAAALAQQAGAAAVAAAAAAASGRKKRFVILYINSSYKETFSTIRVGLCW